MTQKERDNLRMMLMGYSPKRLYLAYKVLEAFADEDDYLSIHQSICIPHGKSYLKGVSETEIGSWWKGKIEGILEKNDKRYIDREVHL